MTISSMTLPPPIPTELMERIGRILPPPLQDGADCSYFSKLDMHSGSLRVPHWSETSGVY